MANLFTGRIATNGYETLASKTSLTFTADTKYTIQIQNVAYLREGTTGKGFIVDTTTPITYTAGSDDLYIKADSCIVNIAE